MEDMLFLGIHLINMESFQILAIKFFINFIHISILIFGIYYPIHKNNKYLFNFFMFNILIFFIASFLGSIQLEAGFAFGLFAILSILRYRTKTIPIREMTFMFISIILATINSTVTQSLSYAEILFANIIILLISFVMERLWFGKYKPSKTVEFERIELIHQDRKIELIAELEHRMGCKISDVEVQEISYLKDTAVLKVIME